MDSKLFYKGLSKIYDLLDLIYFADIEKSPRRAVCEFLENNDLKILDICTGTGSNAINLAKNKMDVIVVGIDISKEMLKVAKKKRAKQGISNLKLYNMDAIRTRFLESTFDVILLSLVLHEMPNDVARKLLLEAKRVLKPDGKLLVVEWEEPQALVQKALFYPIRKLEPKGFEAFLEMDIEKYYKSHGLTIREIKYCNYTKVICLKGDYEDENNREYL